MTMLDSTNRSFGWLCTHKSQHRAHAQYHVRKHTDSVTGITSGAPAEQHFWGGGLVCISFSRPGTSLGSHSTFV